MIPSDSSTESLSNKKNLMKNIWPNKIWQYADAFDNSKAAPVHIVPCKDVKPPQSNRFKRKWSNAAAVKAPKGDVLAMIQINESEEIVL